METPSSIRRVTRAFSSTTTNNIPPMSSSSVTRQRNVKPSSTALIDITNDSPIVGLATGGTFGTPSSLIKKRQKTPESGEALLRGQVKILLQKVEEDGSGREGVFNSLLFAAPTPRNTPEDSQMEDSMVIAAAEEVENESILRSEKSDVTRFLLFEDFFEKSASLSPCSSVVTTQDSGSVVTAEDGEEDDTSVWSVQLCECDKEIDEEKVDQLCEGLSKIYVQKTLPDFEGKHTRFVYNSDDDEIQREEIVCASGAADSLGVLRLKGVPPPEGKHLRFPEED